ncbi:hypothetical protein BH24ACI5_BH24ACI5_21250 [soil metagenome]
MIRVLAVIALLALTELPAPEPAQLGLATARVFAPPTVLFQIRDVGAATPASSVTTVSFDNAILILGHALRISVKADGDIVMPGGGLIPSTTLAWTASNATNGIGMHGSLNKLTYTPVFQGNANATAGGVNLSWTLSAPGGSVTAGTGEATLRWKFEAITP